MPRRREVPKRVILPDPKYHDLLVAKFVNGLMLGGKKSTAEQILYGAFDLVAERSGNNPIEVMLEVKSRRVGGSTYQVPIEVTGGRRTALAIRWLITYARGRNEKTMRERLAGEILDAANNRGAAVKKREDTHRMADANKAFAHYRW
jgi:small subunit ribosomal protein S7